LSASVRPRFEGTEVLCGVCGEDEISGVDSDGDVEGEERIKVKGVKNVYLPSQPARARRTGVNAFTA